MSGDSKTKLNPIIKIIITRLVLTLKAEQESKRTRCFEEL